MNRLVLALVLALSGCAGANAEPPVAVPDSGNVAVTKGEPAALGKPAPGFTLDGLDGRPVSLADYAGKTVVLEWFNPDCPFVKYAHGPKGPLRGQAARHTAEGVVWLAINSSAAGKQGHGADRNREATKEYGMEHPVLLDESGAVGRLYGARTTPHMYVINGEGILVYAGGLDDAPLGNKAGEPTNHVDAALADLAAGRAVQTPSTKPYGCSVKYGS